MANEVLKNDTSISLSWNPVTGATNYYIEVSKNYLDFRATVEYSTFTASTNPSYTAVGDGKRYWRWKPYVSGSWQPYREVSSFTINTSLAGDISATSWMLINKTSISDYYILELQPMSYRIEPVHEWEAFRRNRKGKFISEQYITNDNITLDLSRSYLGNNQKAEIMRFYNSHISFYLATRINNQLLNDYVYLIWEVMFSEIPQFDTPGDNLLVFTEV